MIAYIPRLGMSGIARKILARTGSGRSRRGQQEVPPRKREEEPPGPPKPFRRWPAVVAVLLSLFLLFGLGLWKLLELWR
jgi:hypothetical protein